MSIDIPINLSLWGGERLLSSHDGISLSYSVLYSGMLYEIATLAFDRCKLDGNLNDAITCIIFSAAAVEAYLNELSEVSEAYGIAAGDEILKTLASVLSDAEDSRLKIKTKATLAKKFLTGATYDRGANPYQNFSLLIDLRNMLVHTRPRGSGIANPTNQDQKILRNLISLGLSSEPLNDNFVMNIANLKVAHFCCNAASDIILDLDKSYEMPKDTEVALMAVLKTIPEQGTTQIEGLFPKVEMPASLDYPLLRQPVHIKSVTLNNVPQAPTHTSNEDQQ